MTSAVAQPGRATLGFHLDDVDVQHARLEKLLTELIDALKKPETKHRNICAAFERLVTYSRIHFADEEQFMEERGLPEALFVRHQNAHREFLGKLASAHRQLCNGTSRPSVDGIEALVLGWFEAHRAHEDDVYVEYCQRQDR